MIGQDPSGGRPEEDSEVAPEAHEFASSISGVITCLCGWKSNHNAWMGDSLEELDRHIRGAR